LSISEFELLRWLPPLVCVGIILVFNWLAQQILNSKSMAFIATAFYAVMPNSSNWLIMGGGLTRSLGILFSLLAIGYAYHLFRGNGDKRTLGLTALFSSLALLSHPEAGLQTAALCVLMWAVYGRNSAGLRNLVVLGLGTALLSSWWWLTVLRYHGFSPFWSAIHTGIHETLLASFFHSFFSTQGGLPILTVFTIMGIFVVLRRKDSLLLLWALIPFFVDPRNGSAIALYPSLMLAAEGVYYLHMEFVRAYKETFSTSKNANSYLFVLTNGTFVIILLFFYFVAYRGSTNLVRISLTQSDRETMSWVRENTPQGSIFLLMTNTGQISPMTDAFQEWFPVLAERQSRNTLQGLEWILGPGFFEYSQELVALQTCPDVQCLNNWLEQKNSRVDFILLQKKRASPALLDSLQTNASYEAIYNSESTEIFAVRP
jgi:hypothetical protein